MGIAFIDSWFFCPNPSQNWWCIFQSASNFFLFAQFFLAITMNGSPRDEPSFYLLFQFVVLLLNRLLVSQDFRGDQKYKKQGWHKSKQKFNTPNFVNLLCFKFSRHCLNCGTPEFREGGGGEKNRLVLLSQLWNLWILDFWVFLQSVVVSAKCVGPISSLKGGSGTITHLETLISFFHSNFAEFNVNIFSCSRI